MSKQSTTLPEREGFTIIEVVLVLAIAGLIFLMVFVALPSLQRSQRDTQRRNDLSRLGTALTQWQTNHGTALNNLPKASSWPGAAQISSTDCGSGANVNDACLLVRDYMNTSTSSTVVNTFIDPDGRPYSVVIGANIASGTPSTLQSPALTNPTLASGAATLKWDTTSNSYSLEGANAFAAHTVFVVPGGKCDGDTISASESRRYAIIYRLEGAGIYCLDDQ